MLASDSAYRSQARFSNRLQASSYTRSSRSKRRSIQPPENKMPAQSPVHFIKTLLFVSLLCMTSLRADEAPQLPWESSSFSVETGVLWEIGTGTPISYRLVPTQFSWRSAEAFGHVFSNGSRILVRHRLTLIGSWIQNGPESHYFAVVGSPSVELWDKTAKWCLFTGSSSEMQARMPEIPR